MTRLVLWVLLILSMPSVNAAPTVALDCRPCTLKTISDSAVEIELGLQAVASNPNFEDLELTLWAIPHRLIWSGWPIAKGPIDAIESGDEGRRTAVIQAKLRDVNAPQLNTPIRLAIEIRSLDELVSFSIVSPQPMRVPIQTMASDEGLAFASYPNLTRDISEKTFSVTNLKIQNFSTTRLTGGLDISFLLCEANGGPRVFGSCVSEGFAEFSSNLQIDLDPNGSADLTVEGALDTSLIPENIVPERFEEIWLKLQFGDEETYQALGTLDGEDYQNQRLSFESPDLFVDDDDDGVIDHHKRIFGLAEEDLEDTLDIYLLYGDSISNELGENLEARAMLGISMAEKMLREAGVDANIRVIGMENVGEDNGLLNDEIFDRIKEKFPAWASSLERAEAEADFVFYLHNDVDEDTTDGLATLNGYNQGGNISPENRIRLRAIHAVVDIDEGARVSTFAHELGHLLGLGHSRRQVYESIEENDRNSSPGTFPWSVGHGVDSEFVTTMGYESKFNVRQKLELFSDPTKTCSGSFTCGVDKSNPLQGADASTTLRFTYPQAKEISHKGLPYIFTKQYAEVVKIPQGEFWKTLRFGSYDVDDGFIDESVEIVSGYDLKKIGRQSVMLQVQDSDKNSAQLEVSVEVLSDRDRDAISDEEELAVGTNPDDQSSCFDCYVFQDGVRAGLRGTHGSDFLDPKYDASLTDAFITSYGLGGDDFIYGLEKDDALFGGLGSDVLRGYDGADELFGGPDGDSLYGGIGDDILSGDEGSDVLRGEEGNDLLIGGEGFDFLLGGPGNDKLIVEKGGGLLSGDAGSDMLFVNTEFDEEESYYYVEGFELEDSLALSTSIETVRSGGGSTGEEFQAIELSNNSTIYIYEPFVGMPELSQIICSSDTSLDDYSAFRGGSANCDLDGDQVVDSNDSFPLDRFETVDTDLDGIGNNTDLDDDNDGFTDEEELADGTDPLSRFSCRTGCVLSFDVDGNLEAKALSDGLLVIRHLFGFSGNALTSDGVIAGGANRKTSEAISKYLTEGNLELDIDGNGQSDALTDGMLLIRYLFGFSGESLIKGAIGSNATRNTAEAVEAYIKERVPTD